ncbi:Flp pilus assembly protein TadD [Novosphingobium sp. PhB165]|uniref:tetratricopeptide repeat-containing sulfotransferase family protein n=1 Tax=Novosphingobium sp. PhB165 TaxID=2485105 RepID=UPI0010521387|nr:tetratricopeptide repeat-containing sulfotransferase family protein [Novosphingobium sp. PhB165]TCM18605.1 Flp pilus assembly protein TadD [Novosphingobium sp. PhB165]
MRAVKSPEVTEDLMARVQHGSASLSEEGAIELAGEFYSRGRYRQAVNACRQIIDQKPVVADAHNILGVSLAALGQARDGIASLRQAIALRPLVANYHANLGEILRTSGDLTGALPALTEAVRLDPRNAQALNNLGIARYEQKEFEAAIACYRDALLIDPNFAEAYNNLGNALRLTDQCAEARGSYERALALRENYPEVYNNLGTLLREDGKNEQAAHALRKAIQQKPDYLDARQNLATILHTDGDDLEALRELSEILKISPRSAKALLLAARIQTQRGNPAAAEQACRMVLEDDPASSPAHAALASVMHDIDRFDEAVEWAAKAVELDPEDAEARNFHGVALKSVGRLDEARKQLLEAVRLNPALYGAYANLNDLVDFSREPELFAALSEQMEKETDSSGAHILPLHYAYAKALDDTGEPEQALDHYIRGGRIKRSVLNYVETDTAQFFADIKATFSKEFFRETTFAGNPSERPIFIVGMPRSGSTLVEQILSAHPDVFGAGEVKHLNRVLHGLRDRFPSLSHYPQIMGELSEAHLAGMASRYLEMAGANVENALRISDKLLTNYYFVGLIHVLFPNARFINTRRNPVDTCLSAFTKLFKDDMPHSYDLAELGRYYRMYEDLMDHWQEVLPAGVMMAVQYEDVVAHTEETAREIVSFLGLEWDDACLAFHESRRPVKTASVAQVRKPIYTSALERWRRYGPGLAPLIGAIEGDR